MNFSHPPARNAFSDGYPPGKKRGWRWTFRLLGPVLFIFLIRHFDYRQALRMITGMPPAAFVSAFLLFWPLNFFKSIRWAYLLRCLGVRRSVATLFNLNVSSFAPSLLSPGRMAEFVKVLPLVDRDCPAAVALGSAVLDRMLDLAFVLAVGTGGVLLIFGAESALKLTIIVATASLSLIFCLWILPRVLSGKLAARYLKFLNEAGDHVRKISAGTWLTSLLLTGMLWLSYFLSIRVLAAGLGIPMGLGSIFLVFSSIAVLNLVPVSVAGIGTRDAILLVYFSNQAWQAEMAMALAGSVLALLMLEAAFSFAYFTVLSWLRPGRYGDTGQTDPVR